MRRHFPRPGTPLRSTWPTAVRLTVTAAILAVCAQAPLVAPPVVAPAAAFAGAATDTGTDAATVTAAGTAAAAGAASATASAAAPLQDRTWWRQFQDPALDALQQQLLANSPDLASALARYQQARAATDTLRAAESPTVGASLNVQRDRQSDLRPLRGATSPSIYNSGTLGLEFQYEVDLWGRVRQQVRSGEVLERAAGADLDAARLSLQTRLADTVFAVRGIDAEIGVLRDTEIAYQREQDLIVRRHQGGVASGLDLARADSQLQTSRSQLRQLEAQRAVLAHAIAALVGANASTFTLAVTDAPAITPPVPAGLPSQLLVRRPDIAAARLRVAAAGERVGVARTAFFPALTLGASGGFQTSDLGRFASMPNLYWALGPTLAMSLFDGGRRNAQIASEEAALDDAGQRYRAVVLGAFQQVEDQLAQLQRYGEAAQSDAQAARAAQRALALADQLYQQGAANYLEVITAQTAYLQARRSEVTMTTRQRQAAVQLVGALGGGWNAGG